MSKPQRDDGDIPAWIRCIQWHYLSFRTMSSGGTGLRFGSTATYLISLLSQRLADLTNLIDGELRGDLSHHLGLIVRTNALRKETQLDLQILRLLPFNARRYSFAGIVTYPARCGCRRYGRPCRLSGCAGLPGVVCRHIRRVLQGERLGNAGHIPLRPPLAGSIVGELFVDRFLVEAGEIGYPGCGTDASISMAPGAGHGNPLPAYGIAGGRIGVLCSHSRRP